MSSQTLGLVVGFGAFVVLLILAVVLILLRVRAFRNRPPLRPGVRPQPLSNYSQSWPVDIAGHPGMVSMSAPLPAVLAIRTTAGRINLTVPLPPGWAAFTVQQRNRITALGYSIARSRGQVAPLYVTGNPAFDGRFVVGYRGSPELVARVLTPQVQEAIGAVPVLRLVVAEALSIDVRLSYGQRGSEQAYAQQLCRLGDLMMRGSGLPLTEARRDEGFR